MTMLGSGFRPRTIDEPPAPVVPTDTERVLAALADLSMALRAAQAPPPPPQIIIPEPDLGAIVTAVNGLKPGADAQDVARAVVAQLAPPPPPGDNSAMSETLERVADTLKALDFRMQAPTSMVGGGIVHFDPAQLNPDGTLKVNVTSSGSSDVTDRAARLVGHVTVDSAPAVTGTVGVNNFPATQTTDPTDRAARLLGHVTVDSAPTTAVTGTFWQATQPVSIATNTPDVTDRAARLLGHVTVDSAPTTAVTGTFWQATQPVSLATNTPDVTDRAARLLGHVTVDAVPTITKGTQGSTGFTTQDLKDAGRNVTSYATVLPVLTTASEALLSLTGYKSGAAVGATTTPAVVTTGKTYRITHIDVTYVAVATAGTTRMSLRVNTGGAVAVTSPVIWQGVVGGPAAVAGVAETVTFDFPDGIEIPAGAGIGVSQLGLGATQAAAIVGYGAITVYGYEY